MSIRKGKACEVHTILLIHGISMQYFECTFTYGIFIAKNKRTTKAFETLPEIKSKFNAKFTVLMDYEANGLSLSLCDFTKCFLSLNNYFRAVEYRYLKKSKIFAFIYQCVYCL